jgi:hypothetical protein
MGITGTSEDGNFKELLWDNFNFDFLASFVQHTQSNKRLELINIVPNDAARSFPPPTPSSMLATVAITDL